MTKARQTTLGVLFVLAVAPLAALQACGGSNSTSASGDGGSDDGTVDGASGDGSGGEGSSSSSGGGGDSSRTDGAGDGGHNDGGVCKPGCPANVTCGRYTDCKGNVLTCGAACPKGQTCVASGGAQSCQTVSCTGKCGDIGVDPCGVPINCGGCTAPLACVNNQCVTQPPPTDGGGTGCSKLTCTPDPNTTLCGTVSDGCGHTMQCSCPMGQECLGGVCGAPPPECMGADGGAGSKCGNVENACGSGTVPCGSCTGTTTCTGNTCTPCTPPTCGTATCGEVGNGCGPKVSCGMCQSGQECVGGTCCTPQTCAEASDAGLVTGCAPVDLGCGVTQVCMKCPTGDVCHANACCTPLTCATADAGTTGCDPVDLGCGVMKVCNGCATGQTCKMDKCVQCTPRTCADFGNTGCGHDNGCGGSLDCCGSGGTVCTDGLCCQPGDVDYQGSCCKPQCDPSQPPGTQVSCGQVIYCGSGSQ
jgi:hypothetical protein